VRWVYSCDACFEPVDNDREVGPEDNLKDPQVQAAKALLLAAPSSRSADMLRAAGPTLDTLFRGRQAELQNALGNVGIDWSMPLGQARRNGRKAVLKKPAASSQAAIRMEVETPDGVLEPGVESKVTLHFTNEGRQPLHRLRAVTEGDFFGGREFFFGKVPAGETRSFSVKVKPALWLNARTDEVTWHFFTESGPAPNPFVSRLQIRDVPHPSFAFSYQVIDDGSGSSMGNGDGLLQPGEEIDLLVTVRNKGEGATSDIWVAQRSDGLGANDRGAAEKPGDPEAEDSAAAGKKNGFIRLRNRSGEAIFLTRGSDTFSVQAGGEYSTRLHFRVAEGQGSLDAIALDLTVGDSKFLEILNADIELPLFQPTEAIKTIGGIAIPSSRRVAVRSGASQHSEVIAHLNGPVKVEGRLGKWLRLHLPWGSPGWVDSTEVSLARRGKEGPQPSRYFSNSPPTVTLNENPGGSVVSAARLRLEGRVEDDNEIVDIFVFVNQKKVRYESVPANASSQDFAFDLELEPGENRIEIFARDDQDHLQGLVIGVYRESAQAHKGALIERAQP
jgi:carboxyl-terminal processing protease